MLKFFSKNNGSVSIFLAILLLPMMTLSAVLVDAANLNMSKAVVESSGELALSSAMANYNTILEDVYGLFAISQDVNDLQTNVTKYFEDTLKANGLFEDAVDAQSNTGQMISDTLDNVFGVIRSDDLNNNFLDISVSNITLTAVPGSSLADSAILKNQIIEFMKYRGIAEVGLDLISTLSAFKSVNDKAKVADAQTEVAKEQVELADKVSKFYKGLVTLDGHISDIQGKMDNIDYSKFNWPYGINETSNITCYLYSILGNSADLSISSTLYEKRAPLNQDYQEYTASGKTFYKLVGLNYSESGNLASGDTYSASPTAVESGSADSISTAYTTLVTAYNQLTNNTELDTKKVFLDYNANSGKYEYKNKYTDVESAYQCYRGKETYLGNLISNWNTIEANYSAMETAATAEAEEQSNNTSNNNSDNNSNNNSNNSNSNNSNTQNASQETPATPAQDAYEAIGPTVEDARTKAKAALATFVPNYVVPFTNYYIAYKKDLSTAEYTTGCCVKNLYDELNPTYEAIKQLQEDASLNDTYSGSSSNFIDKLISLGETVKTEIDAVKEKNDSFSNAADSYATNQSQDSYYATMKGKAKENENLYSKEDVQEVIDQLKKIKTYLFDDDYYGGGLKQFLSSYLIYGKSIILNKGEWYSDDSYAVGRYFGAAAKQVLNAKADYRPGYYSDYVTVAKTTYDHEIYFIHAEKEMRSESYLKQISEKLTSTTRRPINFEVLVPKFYFYLETTYGANSTSNPTLSDDEGSTTVSGDNLEGAGNQLNNTAKENKNADARADGAKSLPDNYTGKGAYALLTNSSGGGGDTPDSVDNSKTGILDYMKSMISLVDGLIGVLSNGLEGARDSLFITEYIDCNFSDYAYLMKEGDDSVFGGNYSDTNPHITLTNVPITNKNNPLFGYEAEYILYGKCGENKSDLNGNINLVKGNIFAIRFVCNLVYALTDGEIDTETLPPALAIQAATMGIFPYQVAQLIMKVCLALAESAYDVASIMSGKKVALFKDSSTWVFSLKGMVQAAKNELTEQAKTALKNKVSDCISSSKEKLQEFLDGKVQDAEACVNGIVSDFTDSVESKLMEYISSLTSRMESEVMTIFQKVVCTNELPSIDESMIRSRLETAIDDYLTEAKNSGAMSSKIYEFLSSQKTKIVDAAMNARVPGSSESITSILQSYNTAKANATTDVMKNLSEQMQKLTASIESGVKSYLESAKSTIDGKVSEWTGSLSDEITSEINNATDNAADKINEKAGEAIDNVTDKLSSKMDELFPGDKKVNLGTSGEASSSGIASMLKFGYHDYLRLFMFLQVSGSHQSEVLNRIAYVIAVNVKSTEGLKSYYTSKFPGADISSLKSKFPAMDKTYTYVQLSADIEMKPLLLSKDLFTKGAGLDTVSDPWSYQYTSISGY